MKLGLHCGAAIPDVPYAVARSLDFAVDGVRTYWRLVEPKKGEFNFAGLDKFIAATEGKYRIFTLTASPDWAVSADKPSSSLGYGARTMYPPDNMQDWIDYVRAVIDRYGEQINAVEVWNEPNLPDFYLGDMQTLIRMVKEAWLCVQRSEKPITVMTPPVSRLDKGNGIDFIRRMFEAGLRRWIDAVALHTYATAATLADLPRLIDQVRIIVGDLPIWSTEQGFNWQGMSAEQAVTLLARSVKAARAAGLEALVWYTFSSPTTGFSPELKTAWRALAEAEA